MASLKLGLSSLPQPRNDYEIVVPEDAEDGVEMADDANTFIEDQGDLDARATEAARLAYVGLAPTTTATTCSMSNAHVTPTSSGASTQQEERSSQERIAETSGDEPQCAPASACWWGGGLLPTYSIKLAPPRLTVTGVTLTSFFPPDPPLNDLQRAEEMIKREMIVMMHHDCLETPTLAQQGAGGAR